MVAATAVVQVWSPTLIAICHIDADCSIIKSRVYLVGHIFQLAKVNSYKKCARLAAVFIAEFFMWFDPFFTEC